MTDEDPLILSAYNLVAKTLKHCQFFNLKDCSFSMPELQKQHRSFAEPHEQYLAVKANMFELAEIIHDLEAIDLSKLSAENRARFDRYFPTIEIAVDDPTTAAFGQKFKLEALQRVLGEDYEREVMVAIRANTITNALASSGDRVLLQQVRTKVDPDVRKVMVKRLQGVILRRAEDIVAGGSVDSNQAGLQRYWVDIPEDLTVLIREKGSSAAASEAMAYMLSADLIGRLIPKPRAPGIA